MIGGVHGVLDMFVTPQYVYVAGEFDNIGSEAIEGVARFANLGDHPPVVPPTQPPGTSGHGNPGGGRQPGTTRPSARPPPRSGTGWSVPTARSSASATPAHFGNATPAAGSTASTSSRPRPGRATGS